MTNHEPNDLSHLSDAEFNSLCPQGEHAPGPEPLSPAAQAVLDAATEGFWRSSFNSESNGAAAALRATAGYMFPNDTAQQCHDRILAIADELDN